jgi:BirA family transcriptional regulator, biotin operon repressor / biotin---[acetyl-CoA-carboxylase] ligase
MMNDEQQKLDSHSSFRIPHSSFVKRILEFDIVSSTNSIALDLADDPANHGLVVLTREQTAGRGQYGRSWMAPAGSSVLLSILLFPPPALRRPALLTAWAAVSVCDLCRQLTGLHPRIKWPNDVLIQDRKVCGILIEQRAAGPDKVSAVVGIGLNVNQNAAVFAEAGLAEAASLAVFTNHQIDCRCVAEDLLQGLDREYQHLAQGDLGSLESRWKQYFGLCGLPVSVTGVKETIEGRLVDLSFAGLELEVQGETICLQPEAVRQVTRV